jgi:hypothetical protein
MVELTVEHSKHDHCEPRQRQERELPIVSTSLGSLCGNCGTQKFPLEEASSLKKDFFFQNVIIYENSNKG